MEDKYYKYDQLTIHKEGLIMKIAKTIAISMFVGMLLLAFGCKKDSDDGTSPMPGAVDIQMSNASQLELLSANVDVKAVQLHYAGAGWVQVATNEGLYDLLNLKANAFAIVARESEMMTGKVTQMRLVLGDRNTVTVVEPLPETTTIDTVSYPLQLSGQSDMKFNLNTEVVPGKRLIVSFDFDAKQSVTKEGTVYKLNPVVTIQSIAYR